MQNAAKRLRQNCRLAKYLQFSMLFMLSMFRDLRLNAGAVETGAAAAASESAASVDTPGGKQE